MLSSKHVSFGSLSPEAITNSSAAGFLTHRSLHSLTFSDKSSRRAAKVLTQWFFQGHSLFTVTGSSRICTWFPIIRCFHLHCEVIILRIKYITAHEYVSMKQQVDLVF